jgi:hypothetical protein
MAGVTSRILDQILLVVFLGAVKRLERCYFGDDFALPISRGIHGLDDFFSGMFL